MKRFTRFRGEVSRSHLSAAGRRISAALFVLALLILTVALLAARIHNFDLSSLLLGITLPALIAVAFFLFNSLSTAREQERQAVNVLDRTEASLHESEERFRQMADNIQEIFWMIDAETRRTLYVNPAFESMTGHSTESLKEDPLFYEHIIHQDDRVRVLLKLEQATKNGDFDEQFRIVVVTKETRWVWARGFPVKDNQNKIRRLVGTVMDITRQKIAEEEVAKHLALAKASLAEADAMREATLAMTQDLRMDNVLDTLLRSLAELIPYEIAQIMLVESESRLFLARALPCAPTPVNELTTIDAVQFPLVLKVLRNQIDITISDSAQESDWQPLPGMSAARSWLCVRLIASNRVLGLLCVGHSAPGRFTAEHERLTRSLAIPAAAAIQNARLYECAKIYGTELERRTSDLRDAQDALTRLQSNRPS
jgi:PAS domain S-box-containing protein